MRAYCERKQYGAVHLLGQTTAAPLPRSVRSPPASDAGREEMFISVVQEATQRYKSAENDMAKGGVRAWRKEAICRLLPSLAVDSWNGEIYSLSSNSEGKGVVEIMIAPNIYMKTWNNSLSDSHDHTLIDPNSRVFQVLSGMKKGDHIRFSGSFSPSEADCVGEPSLTQNGSMSEPEFIFSSRLYQLSRCPTPHGGHNIRHGQRPCFASCSRARVRARLVAGKCSGSTSR